MRRFPLVQTKYQGLQRLLHETRLSCNLLEASLIKGYEGQRQRAGQSADPRRTEAVVHRRAYDPTG